MSGSVPVRLLTAGLLAATSLICQAFGCSTPVFRYALERWDASPYLVFVCRDGALTPEQLKRAELLKPADENAPQPNLDIQILDLSLKDDPVRKQLEQALGKPLDQLVRRSPDPQVLILWPVVYGRGLSVFWSGPLDATELNVLTDSPLRRAAAQNLLRESAIVWLLVESGDAAADLKIETLLRERLKKLEAEIELPTPDEDPALVQDQKPKPAEALRPKFTVLKMKPGLPEERMFEKMLRLDERWKEKKTPLLYPIYGRGRLLGALSGDEIEEDVIGQVAQFLTGACSCQVKEGNPGYDLLMTVDWVAGLENGGAVDKALPPLISPTRLAAAAKAAEGLSKAEPARPAETAVPAAAEPEQAPPAVVVNVLLVVGVLVGVILVAGFLMRQRRS